MRFEVNVDDNNNLSTLNRAREAYNAKHSVDPEFVPSDDMPTFVQRLIDRAVVDAIAPFGPTTLADALAEIATLQAAKTALEDRVAAADAAAAEVAAEPVALAPAPVAEPPIQ